MASRGYGWFDEAKLLPSERQVRFGSARLRVSGPPARPRTAFDNRAPGRAAG